MAEHYVKVARDVDGAGYKFLEGDITHVVAFVFIDEEEFNAAKSRFSRYDVGSVELRAERVKVSRRGKENLFYETLTAIPERIRDIVIQYERKGDFDKAFKSLSLILSEMKYNESICESDPTIDEERRSVYLGGFKSQIEAIESAIKKVSNGLKVLSKLNYLLVEVAVGDVNFRKMLA